MSETQAELHDEGKRLILAAFAAARDKGVPDWRRMTSAVLKNRLLALTNGQFDERRWNATSFRQFLAQYLDLLRIDSSRHPPIVELRDGAVDVGPTATGEPQPATSAANPRQTPRRALTGSMLRAHARPVSALEAGGFENRRRHLTDTGNVDDVHRIGRVGAGGDEQRRVLPVVLLVGEVSVGPAAAAIAAVGDLEPADVERVGQPAGAEVGDTGRVVEGDVVLERHVAAAAVRVEDVAAREPALAGGDVARDQLAVVWRAALLAKGVDGAPVPQN